MWTALTPSSGCPLRRATSSASTAATFPPPSAIGRSATATSPGTACPDGHARTPPVVVRVGRQTGTMLDDDTCYRAVQSHDARFDGWFYTAVRTTGIYCRPSCP